MNKTTQERRISKVVTITITYGKRVFKQFLQL